QSHCRRESRDSIGGSSGLTAGAEGAEIERISAKIAEHQITIGIHACLLMQEVVPLLLYYHKYERAAGKQFCRQTWLNFSSRWA
ncbi:MAG: hypothetical protein WBL77_06535, partial [Pseudolabrys sp.]